MGFNHLVSFFKERLGPQASPDEVVKEKDRAIRMATIACLLEIAYADQSLSVQEERHLVDLAKDMFGANEDETRELIEAADEMRAHTIDHWAITNQVRRNSTLEARIGIVKAMWRIVYADDHLHQYEGYLVRKLADLLGLEHHVMINAKLEVQKELGR